MKTYPLFKVHVDSEKALLEIDDVFRSGFINEGTQVTKLTESLKRVLWADNLILLNSCTSALTVALHLAGVGPGDEVITTPMTCVATNTPIVASGAKIVWADIDPEHGMLDPADVAARITPQTRAVMVVAWAGTSPDLRALRGVCDRAGVPLILDAAHAFDAHYEDHPVHEIADYTCYSFQAIKHFTTGDGGALVCKDLNDHARSKALKWFGLDRDATKDAQGNWKGQQWDADIVEAGYKFNMNNVSAAIGLSQLAHVDRIMQAHRRNGALYDELLQGCFGITCLKRPLHSDPSHWVYTAKVSSVSGMSRDELLKQLNAEGIMAGVVHVPNDAYTCFRDFKRDLPGVRYFSAMQFSLPCGWWLDEGDVRHIAQRVKELTT